MYKKENTSKLKSFLSDFAGKFPKERNVLNVLIEEDVQEKLQNLKNVNVFFLQNLHAKCYLNESKLIITSMNLYEYSENNREMEY